MGESYIDNLLSKVEDESVRTQLTNEINKLRDNKAYGLVFEHHLPEYVRLYNRDMTEGAHVQLKTSKSDDIYTVREIKGKKAKIADKDGSITEEKLVDLVFVIRHGDSIYPGLVEVDRVERGDDKPFHTVINAENYHILQLLLYTHEGKIDCIYIDPPYNTGAKDWRYNNDYVDSEDRYRHSKWLSFMEKRLVLAKRLLKPDGVMIVTIDEHEVHTLGLLLQKLFPTDKDNAAKKNKDGNIDSTRIQMVTIVMNTAGSTSKGKFSRAEEYAFFCFFGSSEPNKMPTDMLAETKTKAQYWFPLHRSRGLNDTPTKRSNLVYPIGVDPENMILFVGPSLKDRVESGSIDTSVNLDEWQPDQSETVNGFPAIWPRSIGSDSLTVWQLESSKLIELKKEGYVRIRESKSKEKTHTISYVKSGNRNNVANGKVKIIGSEPCGAHKLSSEVLDKIPKTTWKVPEHDARIFGSSILRAFTGGVNFTYPKSPYATRDCLASVISENKEAIVLDFFGGSGTTLQSVSMLNHRDGGRRQCILVTNNEVEAEDADRLVTENILPGSKEYERHGIFQAVTMPRVKAVITGSLDDNPVEGEYNDGHAFSDGFDENVRFLELDYLSETQVERATEFNLIADILWMQSGNFGETIQPISDTYTIQHEGRYAILFNIDHWQEFVDGVKQRDTITHAFIITDSKVQYQQVVKHLSTNIETTMLYEDYLRNFQIGV
jgi:adenine-specific DNA-methyltransferase